MFGAREMEKLRSCENCFVGEVFKGGREQKLSIINRPAYSSQHIFNFSFFRSKEVVLGQYESCWG